MESFIFFSDGSVDDYLCIAYLYTCVEGLSGFYDEVLDSVS